MKKNITAPLLIPILALSLIAVLSGTPSALAQSNESVRGPFGWAWGYWGGSRPIIRDINPESGPVGTTVELVGRKFSDKSVVRFGKGIIDDVTVSQNGKRLSFMIPENMDQYCAPQKKSCTATSSEVDDGEYKVRVQNGTRTSNAINFTVIDEDTEEDLLAISKIDGPSELSVDTEGTWAVNVDAESDEDLLYSVKWGDEQSSPIKLLHVADLTQSSATFTHTYSATGTFTPEFTVTDEDGNTATKTGPKVAVSEDSSNDVPYVSTVTPGSGAIESIVTITGSGFDTDSVVTLGHTSVTDVTVASDSQITFTVPRVTIGTYSIIVGDNDGTSNAVSFTVTNPRGTVSVSGVEAPNRLIVGEDGTWTVHADSKLSGNLSYSVDWGENASMLKRMMATDVVTQSSATFTHAYDTAGTYTPEFTVTDEIGNSASVKVSVKIQDEE